MADLSKANAARLNAALDKQYRFSHGVDTLRRLIEAGRFSHSELGETPRAQYNRRKFNGMDHRQQAEYMRKCNEMKPEYRLYNADCPHGSYTVVPKMVFEWFNARND